MFPNMLWQISFKIQTFGMFDKKFALTIELQRRIACFFLTYDKLLPALWQLKKKWFIASRNCACCAIQTHCAAIFTTAARAELKPKYKTTVKLSATQQNREKDTSDSANRRGRVAITLQSQSIWIDAKRRKNHYVCLCYLIMLLCVNLYVCWSN